MKNLSLNFEQRLNLTAFLASITGSLGKISDIQSVWAQIRFSEEEMSQIKITPINSTQSTFEAPSEDFGKILITLEDSRAVLVLNEIDSRESFTISDHHWLNPVREQLLSPSVPAQVMTISHKKKR